MHSAEAVNTRTNDGGVTFGNKINLSNSADADSVRAQISEHKYQQKVEMFL
jgi:hypothetical protein